MVSLRWAQAFGRLSGDPIYLIWCLGPVTGAVETLRELREKPQGGAENVRYTYSRAVGLGYAPRPGTVTPLIGVRAA